MQETADSINWYIIALVAFVIIGVIISLVFWGKGLFSGIKTGRDYEKFRKERMRYRQEELREKSRERKKNKARRGGR